MARLSNAVAGFIRQIFSREETTSRDLSMSTRELARAGGYNSMGLPGIDSQGFGDIGEALGLDRRLLQRFIDYEQMDEYPDISASLDIYADDATQVDSANRHTVWIECQEEQVRKDLEDMFYHRLRIEEEVWEITRGTSKYGNDYEEIVVGENGVVGLNYLPPATVRRVEGIRGELLGFVQSYSADIQMDEQMFHQLMSNQQRMMQQRDNLELSQQGSNPNTVSVFPGHIPLLQTSAPMIGFEDWQVVHFRLRSKNRDSMYGWAVTDPARWVWKRLTLLEDAVLVYKLTRSPSRYAFYVDVGTLSQKEAERALNEVKDKIKKRKFVNPKCLTAETCVKLLDGTDRSMGELARDFTNEKFWVYSYDLETGKVVPGLASNPRLTDEKQPIYRVVLDNGAVVRCNGIHPFLMRDGTYRPAAELKRGDSLMPLYVSGGAESTQGYNTYKDQTTGKTHYVHRSVVEGIIGEIPDGLHVHHRNGIKTDNRPENLELLSASDHLREHPESLEKARKAFVERVKSDPEFKDEICARLEAWRNRDPERVKEVYSALAKQRMQDRIRTASPGHAVLLSIMESEVVRDPLVTSEELVERLNANPVFVDVYASLPTTQKGAISSEVLRAFLLSKGYRGFKAFKIEKTGQARWKNRTYGGKEIREMNNHKVVSVSLDGYEDVYNLDVEKYHNFLLTAGVFTHNTGKLDLRFNPLAFDEDFFLATREGRESTRVDVLNGPAYQQVEDVQYFLFKLYAALKVPRAYLGYDENMPSKATLCLAGDTPVPLLDGTEPTIAELAKTKKKDEPFWVYSMDENGNVVPGLAKNARLTRKKTQTVEIELDNGEIMHPTLDHPYMMRDGSYERADALKPGDSLMPLYRRRSSGEGRSQKLLDYEQVYDPGTDKWRYTHRVVTDALFDGVDVDQVRHHVNFDRNDNRPENLVLMEKDEHLLLHRDHAEKTLLRPDVKAKRKAAQAEWLKTDEAKESIYKAALASKGPTSRFWDWLDSDEHRELKSKQMTAQWADADGSMRRSHRVSFKEKMSGLMRKRISEGTAPDTRGRSNTKYRADASLEHLVCIAKEYRCSSKKQLIKWSGYSETLINRVLSESGLTYREFSEQSMAKSKMRDAAYRKIRNHKVVAVRPGPVVDTYDLTVDGYHNFAIGQGVFVHNSQEDVRFARTVLRIQREIRNGLHKVARVHLAARKIDPASIDFDIVMTVPSAIFELGQLEVRTARANLAASMERHVSLYWLLSEIYGLSDDQIKDVMKQKEEEMKKAQQGFGGGAGGMGAPVGFENRIRRSNMGNVITEQELFLGRNKEDEKRASDQVRRLMQGQSKMSHQLRETRLLVQDILEAIRRKAA